MRLSFIFALAVEKIAIPFLSANALFPVLGFFLWFDAWKYRVYGPLYAAGKAVCVFSGLVWLFFTIQTGDPLLFMPLFKLNTSFLFLAALILTDSLSLLACLSLRKKTTFQSTFQSMGEIANCE
jgi:hypothetical protein